MLDKAASWPDLSCLSHPASQFSVHISTLPYMSAEHTPGGGKAAVETQRLTATTISSKKCTHAWSRCLMAQFEYLNSFSHPPSQLVVHLNTHTHTHTHRYICVTSHKLGRQDREKRTRKNVCPPSKSPSLVTPCTHNVSQSAAPIRPRHRSSVGTTPCFRNFQGPCCHHLQIQENNIRSAGHVL